MKWQNALLIVLFLCLLPACSNNSEPDKSQAKTVPDPQGTNASIAGCGEILVSVCSKCHNITRICQRLGTRSKREWRNTSNAMIRNGARLGPEEQDKLIDCLEQQSEDIKALCKGP